LGNRDNSAAQQDGTRQQRNLNARQLELTLIDLVGNAERDRQ